PPLCFRSLDSPSMTTISSHSGTSSDTAVFTPACPATSRSNASTEVTPGHVTVRPGSRPGGPRRRIPPVRQSGHRLDDGKVGGQPGNVEKFVPEQPAQFTVLAGLRYALGDVGQPHPKHVAAAHGPVTADPLAEPYDHAQLLTALADQRLLLALPRLHLASGELPAAGQLRRVGALRGQQPPRLDDRGAHDDPIHGRHPLSPSRLSLSQ